MIALPPTDLLEIDPAPIDELLDSFGIDEAREAVVQLADGIERKLAEIERAVAGMTPRLLCRTCHDLASLSGSLGLVGLAAVARSIETACGEVDGTPALDLARTLQAIAARIPFVVANAFVDAVRARLPRPVDPTGSHWSGAA